MPRNIEIKAYARDLCTLRASATALSDNPPQVLHQVDTFFRVGTGRLKLRELGPDRGELIWYERPDEHGPKESAYSIVPTRAPSELKHVLAGACGVRGVVDKTRELYVVGQTRIHLDRVSGLGEFVELEFVLREGQSRQEGLACIEGLMEKLGIGQCDLIERAYIDLIMDRPV